MITEIDHGNNQNRGEKRNIFRHDDLTFMLNNERIMSINV